MNIGQIDISYTVVFFLIIVTENRTCSIKMKGYTKINKNSAEGGVAPAGEKVTGATIRMWLLNEFISFWAVLGWKSDKN